MKIKPVPMSYEDFPESTASAEGMKTIQAQMNAVLRCKTHINVEYANKSNVSLHLQIIKPEPWKDENKKYPLIVYVQGSGWGKQKIGTEISQLSRFASRGYVIAIVQYRDSSVAPFPAQIIDTKSAIHFLLEHAEEYRIDTSNLFLWGDSSGAHTCVMTMLTRDDEYFTDEKGSNNNLNINATIDFYGPTDITKMNDDFSIQDHMSPDSPEGRFIGGKAVDKHPEITKLTNPINYVDSNKKICPMLIIHGSKDRLVPFSQSVLLYKALKKAQKQVVIYKLQGADHGGPAFWTEDIFDIVEKFIKENIQN